MTYRTKLGKRGKGKSRECNYISPGVATACKKRRTCRAEGVTRGMEMEGKSLNVPLFRSGFLLWESGWNQHSLKSFPPNSGNWYGLPVSLFSTYKRKILEHRFGEFLTPRAVSGKNTFFSWLLSLVRSRDQGDWKRKEKREREIGQGNRGRKRKERGKSNHDYYLLKQRGREKKGTEDCFSCWRSLFYSSAQKCEWVNRIPKPREMKKKRL